MTSFIDPTELADAIIDEGKSHKAEATKRIGKIVTALGMLLQLNRNDPFVKGIEIKLGLTEGEMTEAAKLLGFDIAVAKVDTDTESQRALTIGKYASGIKTQVRNGEVEGVLPILDENNESTNDYMIESAALNDGYVLHMNSNNQIDGVKYKPSVPAKAGEKTYELRNKKGKVLQHITFAEGKDHNRYEAIPLSATETSHFVKKGRVSIG